MAASPQESLKLDIKQEQNEHLDAETQAHIHRDLLLERFEEKIETSDEAPESLHPCDNSKDPNEVINNAELDNDDDVNENSEGDTKVGKSGSFMEESSSSKCQPDAATKSKFKCYVCGKGFSYLSQIKLHILIHSEEMKIGKYGKNFENFKGNPLKLLTNARSTNNFMVKSD